jgi:hypothetical protein
MTKARFQADADLRQAIVAGAILRSCHFPFKVLVETLHARLYG